ncbi:hypothetical protein, partial [Burkholderia multivorans]|uniref:hypothetical protein n=1 Tax=Burkholderia multivorans TaxID=87883 RepID=UPI001EE6383E
ARVVAADGAARSAASSAFVRNSAGTAGSERIRREFDGLLWPVAQVARGCCVDCRDAAVRVRRRNP